MVELLSQASTTSLPALLGRAEALIAQLQTHGAYLKVQTLEDTANQDAKDELASVESDQSVIRAALNAAVRSTPEGSIPSPGKYAYLARSAQRLRSHDLAPDVERYRTSVVVPTEKSIADAYDRIGAQIRSPKGISSPDVAVRRNAMGQLDANFDALAPQEAALLGELVELENRDAAAEGYSNAADRKYQELGLSDRIVSSTLAAVADQAPAYRAYQKVLADHAAAQLKVSPVLSSEVGLISARNTGSISLADARSMILSALQPLGRDYNHRFAELLDPANGRLDLSGGVNRGKTGTSINAYEAPTALYYGGYDGSLGAVRVLAHEGGHAIHRELMNAAGLPIYQRSGPHYLFEGFAIFNELLLLDHAAKTAKSPQARQYALEMLLSKLSLEVFVSAEETAFERALYTRGPNEPLLDRGSIDVAFRTSLQPYEYFSSEDVGQSRGWMRKPLLFEDPLYLVNYLYASVIAVALYDRSHSDPEFAVKYEALLRRGFDSEPQVLLATIGIHLDAPDLIKPAARLLEEKTAELQQIYAQDSN